MGLALARVLTPGDFGIQAAVVTITAFFATLTETGIGSAVVQREELEQRELSSVFWGTLAAGVGAWVVVAGASPLAARLFNAPELTVALPVAAAVIPVFCAVVVPAALLRRRLQFATLARAQAAGAIAGAGLAVAMAYAGAGYWALIGYGMASVVVGALVAARAAKWKPSFTFAVRDLHGLRGYAGAMTTFVVVNYWSRNLDDLMIGRFLGVAPLGIYNLAQRFVNAPVQLLTGSVVPLLHPAFAAMGMETPRQRAAYLELVRATALVTFPAAVVLWFLAEPAIVLIAGEQWRESGAVVRALAPLAAVQPVNALCGPVFMARDAVAAMLRTAIIGSLAVILGMALGLRYGVTGVAWGYSAGYVLVSAPVATLVALRLLAAGPAQLGRALRLPLLAAAIAAAVTLGVSMGTG